MEHEKYMRRCFELARRGTGLVSPNPLVGSLLVKDGKIISEGWHREFGSPHAEAEALNQAGAESAGCDLYCNLEPCSHTNKKTPPCVPHIIGSGIKRVVISSRDPNPDVNGEGILKLREAGIEVIEGILEDEGRELNKFFFHFITKRTPYVTIKIAQTLDGKITSCEGKQTRITGVDALRDVHKLRNSYDAVLVGSKTVSIDDPQLNVRRINGRNPIRIVLDCELNLPFDRKIFNSRDPEKTWVFTGKNNDAERIEKLKASGVRVFEFDSDGANCIGICHILKFLGEQNIASLLIEGGAGTFTKFLSANQFDELIVYHAPLFFARGVTAILEPFETVMKPWSVRILGKDTKTVFKKEN